MTKLQKYLYVTVFITGAAVLIIEVTAVRVLSPYYGSSLYVFSSVLTVILAALSIGYWYGGKRADREQSLDILYSIIAISGLTVLILLLASILVLPAFGPSLSVRTGPLLFSIGLFFVPAFLLGIISPYIIKLLAVHTPPEQIGSVVGNTFFWGTMGSILGSLVTGFWLIPTIGVSQTIIFVSIVLISLGLVAPVLLNRPMRTHFMTLVLTVGLLIGGVIYYFDSLTQDNFVYKADGIYSSITIQDSTAYGKPARLLHRDTNRSSAVYMNSKELVWTYAKFVLQYPKLKPDAKNLLLLGGGAYTIPRTLTHLYPSLEIDVVEIEPVLFDLAREYFDLSDISHITNYPMDARVFLSTTEKKYDVIFIDVSGTDHAPPFHLATNEFYELAKEHLTDDGVFFLNFRGVPDATPPSLTGSVIKTILTTFPNTRVFALGQDPLILQNMMFIAQNGDAPIDVGGMTVAFGSTPNILISELELLLDNYQLEFEYTFTDDFAPVEYLLAKRR